MADHRFQQDVYNLEKFPVLLYAYATSADWSTGNPTVTANKSLGISSIARTAQGKYTITLKASYNTVLFADVVFIDDDSSIAGIDIEEDDVDGSTPVVKIIMRDHAGAAADPPANGIALLRLELRNSAAG